MTNALVTGAGGFIGGHLVKRLVESGVDVIGIDIKPLDEWFQVHSDAACAQRDVSDPLSFQYALTHADDIYHLAEDMGGMGYLANHPVESIHSVTMSLNLIKCLDADQRIFFSSSACVYPEHRQLVGGVGDDVVPLAEYMAYPANPDLAYGWAKLYIERALTHHYESDGLDIRIARFHNSYGPFGTWQGGREKAPAAICRKVAEAALSGSSTIDIWGDGEQSRSFMWIDDNIDGITLLMSKDFYRPINIGSSELVTINQLVDTVETVAFGAPKLTRNYINGPQGVRGRNSDNALCEFVLGWQPEMPLINGIEQTYKWIYDQMKDEA